MTPDPPTRDLEQRRAALARGNEIRHLRAVLKRTLEAGGSIGPYLDDPPPWLTAAKVATILLAIPKVGPVKVNRALQALHVSPSKTFGGLSDRQRDELLERFAGDWVARQNRGRR